MHSSSYHNWSILNGGDVHDIWIPKMFKALSPHDQIRWIRIILSMVQWEIQDSTKELVYHFWGHVLELYPLSLHRPYAWYLQSSSAPESSDVIGHRLAITTTLVEAKRTRMRMPGGTSAVWRSVVVGMFLGGFLWDFYGISMGFHEISWDMIGTYHGKSVNR